MNKVSQSNTTSPSKASSSAFIKRGVAIVGSSGLVFGLGFTGATSASANGAVDCTARTVTASNNPAANVTAIQGMLSTAGVVCLSGDFTIDNPISVNRDAHFYGIGNSTVQHETGDWVFVSNISNGGPIVAIYDITIEKLTIKNSGRGVQAEDVFVVDSTFSQNTGGAIFAYGLVTVSNSTFINNSGYDGGAIHAGTSAEIDNSTFDGNTSGNNGGAIYLAINEATESNELSITNSTFQGNSASGEGGAIFASAGEVYFSTFVNNVAPTPPNEPGDIPGNAIYKSGTETFTLAGNIFAGSSSFPQLGAGVAPTPFTDAGGNIFSTTAEPDISGTHSPVFEATLQSLFGTNSPALATYAPNTNGTQTIALGPGSPALDVVPDLAPYNLITLDQRGQTRSFPADAGAFEGFVIPTPTPNSTTPAVLAKTGNENLFWSTLASGSLIVFGTLVAVVTSRIRRRTSNL